jgi:hypothetical protein
MYDFEGSNEDWHLASETEIVQLPVIMKSLHFTCLFSNHVYSSFSVLGNTSGFRASSAAILKTEAQKIPAASFAVNSTVFPEFLILT